MSRSVVWGRAGQGCVRGVGFAGKLQGQKTSSLDRLKARQILKYCFRIFAIAFLAKGK